jgi:hypothetical protein
MKLETVFREDKEYPFGCAQEESAWWSLANVASFPDQSLVTSLVARIVEVITILEISFG